MVRSWVLLLCICGAASHAQIKAPELTDIAPPPSERFPANWYPPDSSVTSTSAPERGAPYTATLITTWEVGTKEISQSTFQARDGAGRQRHETEMPRPNDHGGMTMAHNVEVDDPVSHCIFRWIEPVVAPDKPTATVDCMSRTLHYTVQHMYEDVLITEPKETHLFPNLTDLSEPLGKRSMEGLEAVGMRHTRTQTDPETHTTISLVAELWYSPELHELLEMRQIPHESPKVTNDPAFDFKLTHIERGEPAASLFYPPSGYTIEPGH